MEQETKSIGVMFMDAGMIDDFFHTKNIEVPIQLDCSDIEAVNSYLGISMALHCQPVVIRVGAPLEEHRLSNCANPFLFLEDDGIVVRYKDKTLDDKFTYKKTFQTIYESKLVINKRGE